MINQQSRDYGAEARYENSLPLVRTRRTGSRLGVQPSWLNMANRQFENEAGEHGALREGPEGRGRRLGRVRGERARADARASPPSPGSGCDHAHPEVARPFLSDGDQSDHRVFNPFLPKVGILYALPRSRASSTPT